MSREELNILVIDDDDFQRQCLIEILKHLGYHSVREASDGVEALRLFETRTVTPIDVVLCDLNMPEMDGMEFLRHLGESQPGISTIIISSQNSALITSVKNMARAYGLTLLGTIEKPATAAVLEKLISLHSPEKSRSRTSCSSTPEFTLNEVLQGMKHEQFEPYFQPKMDISTQKIVGAEALARWLHPERGLVPPYAFIGLLEESNNMDDLTFIILKKSLEVCRLLHENGSPIGISVNLSLTSLTDITFADRVIRLVRDFGIDPQYVTLEVTETAAMTDIAHALENLARLRMRGFGLSIDDYGTGYSSMQQITRIAFSELKIDRSFMKDIMENHAMRIIVDSSIGMARKLGITSTAEGVESRQDFEILRSMGCDVAQGYFIAKPMDFSSLMKFFTKQLALDTLNQGV